MRVLLVQACFPGYQEQVAFLEPAGLVLLAAVLEKRGHAVRVVHQVTPDDPTDEAIIALARAFQPDCVGVSSFSENYRVNLDLIKKLRAAVDAPIVLGGVHGTYSPDVALEPDIDLVVLGHAVETFPEILRRLEGGVFENLDGIDGVAYERDGELVVRQPGPFTIDVDALPFARRDDLPIERYKIFPMLMVPPSKQRILSVYTSWGCRFVCNFCLVPHVFQNQRFTQSPERVLDELAYLKRRFGINFVHFHDDDFADNRERTTAICEGMLSRGLNLQFGMMTRFNHLDADLVDLMDRAGLVMITLGIEAGSQEGLKKLRKGLKLETIRAKLELFRGRGIQTNGTYMMGFPWETREGILDAYRFVRGLPLDTWSLNILIPFKGLPIRETLEREGLIETDNLDLYSYKQAMVRTRTVTRAELETLARVMIRGYYFRGDYLRRLIRRISEHPRILRSAIEVFWWGITRRGRLLFRPRAKTPVAV